MCEWCDRLVFRNRKWNRHTHFFGMNWMFYNTNHPNWIKIKKNLHNSYEWIEDHELNRNRKYRGLGSRYYNK